MCSNIDGGNEEEVIFKTLEEKYPGLVVVGGCSGKLCPLDHPCIPENENYTYLKFQGGYPSKESWESFCDFVQYVTEWGSFHDVNDKIYWMRIEVINTDTSGLLIRVQGHNYYHSGTFTGIFGCSLTCPLAGSDPV